MKQELIKMLTSDNIELTGLLYTPINKTNKIVVFVHGLGDDFYKKSFLDYLAKSFTENGYAFFSFNNRGSGYITKLVKRENNEVSSVMGGCVFEIFEKSQLDIQTAIEFVKSLGYNEVTLQGHSFGCSKVINYYNKIKKDDSIKNIILLAPCDIIKSTKNILGEIIYNGYVEKAKTMILNNQGNNLMSDTLNLKYNVTANTFYSVYSNDCNNDIFRYREKEYKSQSLNNIDISVLIQIGDKDNLALSEKKDTIIQFFNNNIKNINIEFIKDSDHSFNNKEQIMSDNCIKWLNNI